MNVTVALGSDPRRSGRTGIGRPILHRLWLRMILIATEHSPRGLCRFRFGIAMPGSKKRFRATQVDRPRRNSPEFHREEFRSSTIYDDRLLFSRKYVMRLLDISYDTIERLEAAGKLRRVQFSTSGRQPGRTTKVLYRREEVLQLIETFTVASSQT